MRLVVATSMLLVLSGCASNSVTQGSHAIDEPEVIVLQKEFPPHVWSGHKELNISVSACAEKGMEALHSLGFVHVLRSEHGEYVYGSYSSNRAAIKCVSVNSQTFVYAIVAGPRKAVVEKLRNQIVWQL